MAGRKKIEIDWEQVDSLLAAGCPGTEVAAYLGMHPETLYDRCKEVYNTDFSAYSQQKKAGGDAMLRAKQYEEAINGNTTMQIWLGKQRLGQKEKQDLDISSGGKSFFDLLAESSHESGDNTEG